VTDRRVMAAGVAVQSRVNSATAFFGRSSSTSALPAVAAAIKVAIATLFQCAW